MIQLWVGYTIIPIVDHENRLISFAYDDEEANREIGMLRELSEQNDTSQFADMLLEYDCVKIYGFNEIAFYFAKYLEKQVGIDVFVYGEMWNGFFESSEKNIRKGIIKNTFGSEKDIIDYLKVADVRDELNPNVELKFGEIQSSFFIDYSLVDLEALYRDTGCQAETDFKESIRKTADWLIKKKSEIQVCGGR